MPHRRRVAHRQLAQNRLQGLSRHQLHRVKRPPRFSRSKSVHGHNVRVRQPGKHLRLQPKLLVSCGSRHGADLDGHTPLQRGIVRVKNAPHASARDLRLQPVPGLRHRMAAGLFLLLLQVEDQRLRARSRHRLRCANGGKHSPGIRQNFNHQRLAGGLPRLLRQTDAQRLLRGLPSPSQRPRAPNPMGMPDHLGHAALVKTEHLHFKTSPAQFHANRRSTLPAALQNTSVYERADGPRQQLDLRHTGPQPQPQMPRRHTRTAHAQIRGFLAAHQKASLAELESPAASRRFAERQRPNIHLDNFYEYWMT